MPIEKLSFQHKEILATWLKEVKTSLSEYSFANLFLFRKFHEYEVLTQDNEIFILGKTQDEKSFVMPTDNVSKATSASLLDVAESKDVVYPVPEEWLGVFPTDKFHIDFIDGDSDYIYQAERLATYKGQKLHSKKNLLNQFLSLYKPEAKPLTKELMVDAQNILDEWQHDVGEEKRETDYYPCQEAFKLYDDLVLCGGIYYVDGEPAGFIIGEELNDKMFAYHFAKGKRKFKGMYQYMFNHFSKLLVDKYEFINFEQDMGKLALKIAKTSYHPDQILKKYRISRKII